MSKVKCSIHGCFDLSSRPHGLCVLHHEEHQANVAAINTVRFVTGAIGGMQITDEVVKRREQRRAINRHLPPLSPGWLVQIDQWGNCIRVPSDADGLPQGYRLVGTMAAVIGVVPR